MSHLSLLLNVRGENIDGDNDALGGLVLILAGLVCYIWKFVLVQTYACVGLYLFSTVFELAGAQTQETKKTATKNSYCHPGVLMVLSRTPQPKHVCRARHLVVTGWSYIAIYIANFVLNSTVDFYA